ncbi:MAG: NDP-sugar synthase, partial [Thermoplasmata archaeon]|nr:NDP-sugar synthase [Thermoplasmata archaeon]
GKSGEGWIFGGVAILEKGVKDYFPSSSTVSLEKDLLPALARDGLLKAHKVTGRFSDAGTLKGLVEAQRIIMDSEIWPFRKDSPEGDGIIPPVYISPNAHVEEGARVGPYATLLDGVRISNGALVKDSLLLENVSVEKGAEVVSSVIMKGRMVAEGEAVLGRIL